MVVRQNLPVLITSLSPLGVSSSLGRAFATLRFDFHAIGDKVCQFPAAGRRFPPGTPVSSANKTDRHVITQYSVESDVKKPIKQTKTIFDLKE